MHSIGREFGTVPLDTSVLERGGKTSVLALADFRSMGFSMVLYPSTVIFQVTKAAQVALEALRSGGKASPRRSVNMDEFERILDIDYWKQIEQEDLREPIGED